MALVTLEENKNSIHRAPYSPQPKMVEESEAAHRQSSEDGYPVAIYGGKALDSQFCASCLSVRDGDRTAQNDQSSQRTDQNGIGKYLEDTEHTLFYRLSGVSTGMGDGTGTKTSLIGEDTTGNALFMLRNMLPMTPPAHCGWRECTFKDGDKHTWNHTPVKNYDAKSQDDVQKCHKRNELFRYLSDGLMPPSRIRAIITVMMIPMARLVMEVCSWVITWKLIRAELTAVVMVLTCVALPGTEYSQDAKACEQICQPEKTPAQTIFNIVHGAAYQISIGIFFTIINR